jgi:hypothetical protein
MSKAKPSMQIAYTVMLYASTDLAPRVDGPLRPVTN